MNFFSSTPIPMNLSLNVARMALVFALLPVAAFGAGDWKTAQPAIQQYCFDCHGGEQVKGDLDYTPFLDPATGEQAFRNNLKLLENMEFLVAENEMPPPTAKHEMPATARKALLGWVVGMLEEAANEIPNDPGVVVMPRLTRDTYNRALSQIAGVEIEPGNVLPPEGLAGEGFSNVGAAHSIGPGTLEKYLKAASETMRYLTASPVNGLQWAEKPPQVPSDEPWQARKVAMDNWRQWHNDQQHQLVNSPDQWYKKENLGHGEYWLQAWRWKHRDALRLQAPSLASLAADSPHDLSPVALQNWLTFFEHPDKADPVIDELRRRWNSIPATAGEAQARDAMKQLEEWYRIYTGFTNGEPDIELKSRDVWDRRQLKEWTDKGQHRYRFDFSQYKGDKKPVRELKFFVTDASDGAEGDVIVFRDGALLQGKNLKKQPEKSVPWNEAPGVEIRDENGNPVAWGSHPDGVQIARNAIGVQAPQILTMTVPESYDGLELEVFVDPERYPEATVQTWISPDQPRSAEGTAKHWIDRRGITAGVDAGRKAKNAVDSRRDVLSGHRVFNNGFLLGHLEELKPFFEGTNRGGVAELRPLRPYELPQKLIYQDASPEEQAEFDALKAEVIASAQIAQQKLVNLFEKHGTKLLENAKPTDEQLASLPADAQQEARNLLHAVAAEEAELAQKAREQLTGFTAKAWRRMPSEQEVDQMMPFYHQGRQAGLSYNAAIKQAMRASLFSVHFIYRYQVAKGSTEPYPIAPHGLADRLAGVLWGSLPDQELLAAANDGSLQNPQVLAAQTQRMLADPRSRALAERFAGEWLGFAGFRDHDAPDPDRFKQFDKDLAAAMEKEAVLFTESILKGERPLDQLITAPETYVNETLASHYGLDADKGEKVEDGFVKVSLPENRQGGILTLGAVLTGTSLPLRTSAVLRGTWILEQVLGEHLPDPPANVPQLSDDETNASGLSVAEQLAVHRDDPACMGCHVKIDPLGIALENFDPIGEWRSEFIDGTEVEAEDRTADGREIDGLQGLKDYLSTRQEEINMQFCKMFAAYALGRAIQPSDRALVESMLAALRQYDNKFPAAIHALVTSQQFRYRRDLPGTQVAANTATAPTTPAEPAPAPSTPASAQPAATPAPAVAAPPVQVPRLPARARLKQATPFPVIVNGREAGKATIPAGSTVTVQAVKDGQALIRYQSFTPAPIPLANLQF